MRLDHAIDSEHKALAHRVLGGDGAAPEAPYYVFTADTAASSAAKWRTHTNMFQCQYSSLINTRASPFHFSFTLFYGSLRLIYCAIIIYKNEERMI